jgi:hypothetical protein
MGQAIISKEQEEIQSMIDRQGSGNFPKQKGEKYEGCSRDYCTVDRI